MKLDVIDWSTISQAQARRLIAPAGRRADALGQRYNVSGDPDDEKACLAMCEVEENLRVFAICGERPEVK